MVTSLVNTDHLRHKIKDTEKKSFPRDETAEELLLLTTLLDNRKHC